MLFISPFSLALQDWANLLRKQSKHDTTGRQPCYGRLAQQCGRCSSPSVLWSIPGPICTPGYTLFLVTVATGAAQAVKPPAFLVTRVPDLHVFREGRP